MEMIEGLGRGHLLSQKLPLAQDAANAHFEPQTGPAKNFLHLKSVRILLRWHERPLCGAANISAIHVVRSDYYAVKLRSAGQSGHWL